MALAGAFGCLQDGGSQKACPRSNPKWVSSYKAKDVVELRILRQWVTRLSLELAARRARLRWVSLGGGPAGPAAGPCCKVGSRRPPGGPSADQRHGDHVEQEGKRHFLRGSPSICLRSLASGAQFLSCTCTRMSAGGAVGGGPGVGSAPPGGRSPSPLPHAGAPGRHCKAECLAEEPCCWFGGLIKPLPHCPSVGREPPVSPRGCGAAGGTCKKEVL